MYDRAFGQDAQATADYVTAVVEEMERAGIGSVLKHFPGYGSNGDTHTATVIDRRTREQLDECDLVPFAAGIRAGATAVLVSHNIVECMDDTLPASLSPEVHRVLREELGFDGLILTDDLAMDAVKDDTENGSAAVLALQAGNDMVVTSDPAGDIAAVRQALESLRPGGILTLCLYYGRNNGYQERDALLELVRGLDHRRFTVMEVSFSNRVNDPPIPIWIVKEG